MSHRDPSTPSTWQSLDELRPEPLAVIPSERPEAKTLAVDRRDFLRVSGFSLAVSLAAGCQRTPVEKAIPFLIQPEEVVPGRPLFYASTCAGCTAGCGVLVKCRDGRPIKLEGNAEHPLSKGGLCAVGQASPLGLFDTQRLSAPLQAGAPASWDEVDRQISQQLDRLAANGGRLRLLTETVNGATELAAIDRFLSRFANAEHVVYDPLSHSAIAQAHRHTDDKVLLPRYRFDRAEVIVSFDADFLGTWISPVEHTADYRAGRDLQGKPPRLSHHVQVEGRLSLTGSNADRRIVKSPAEVSALVQELATTLERRAGGGHGTPHSDSGTNPTTLADELADRLWLAAGRSLVVCGSQHLADQVATRRINQLLGNYGSTVDTEQPSQQRLGDDLRLAELIRDLAAGAVDALLIRGVNPVYDLAGDPRLATALSKVPLLVSFATHRDETARLAGFVCPEPHPLESWRDAEPVAGLVSVTQPAIRPLGDSRDFIASLATWAGQPATAREQMRRTWRQQVFPRRRAEAASDFERFWDQSVHDGFVELEPAAASTAVAELVANSELATSPLPPSSTAAGVFTLLLYPKVALLDGRHAENPFLQELPDPITKVVWDNYASLSPRAADELGVAQGDVVRLRAEAGAGADFENGAAELELPVLVQPGQHDRVVAVALGYGRVGTERFADVGPRWLEGRPTVAPGEWVGGNAATLATRTTGQRLSHREGVRLLPTGSRHPLASTQSYHSLDMPKGLEPAGEPRPIVQETVLAAYQANPVAGAPHAHHIAGDLWPEHEYKGHHWGMAIDLNACTGCSACTIGCQLENNVPVVGKDEVARHRDMHWLRLDRYYRGDPEASEALDIVHQPMLCHHCDNAPCETVCPVLATVHSSEGLNQQVYNRCVGTRYCANNCPYKVRRFNWFNYSHTDLMQNLALNPDVVVRSRGVMEKCSFCVQRIQAAKQEAKQQRRELLDGDIQPACQQSCPARAITFGDLADQQSQVAQQVEDPRHYRLLEELNVRPSVGYLRRVRHRQEDQETHHG